MSKMSEEDKTVSTIVLAALMTATQGPGIAQVATTLEIKMKLARKIVEEADFQAKKAGIND